MPDIEALIKTIVEPLIDNPDEFSVDIVETEDFIEYHLNLHPDDIGRVIGRKGRVVRAIRTIIYSIVNVVLKRELALLLLTVIANKNFSAK